MRGPRGRDRPHDRNSARVPRLNRGCRIWVAQTSRFRRPALPRCALDGLRSHQGAVPAPPVAHRPPGLSTVNESQGRATTAVTTIHAQWSTSFPTAPAWPCPTAPPAPTPQPRSAPGWPERRSRSRSTAHCATWRGRCRPPAAGKLEIITERSGGEALDADPPRRRPRARGGGARPVSGRQDLDRAADRERLLLRLRISRRA